MVAMEYICIFIKTFIKNTNMHVVFTFYCAKTIMYDGLYGDDFDNMISICHVLSYIICLYRKVKDQVSVFPC